VSKTSRLKHPLNRRFQDFSAKRILNLVYHNPNSLSKESETWPVRWFLVGTTAFLYLLLFVPPATPVYLPGDVSVYQLNAMRMLDGQVIYRDFFQFTLPGTELVYFMLFKLFGIRTWIANAMLLALGFSLAWLSITISKRIMNGWATILPGLLFLTFAFHNWLDASHHWFSTIAVLTGLTVVIERRSPVRLAGAGALCGLAFFFTQFRGIVAVLGFAVYLLWERPRKAQSWRGFFKDEVALFAGFVAVIVAASTYFVWRAGFKQFLNYTVMFGVRHYPAFSTANSLKVYLFDPPRIPPLHNLPFLLVYLFIHAFIPLTYVMVFVRYRREAPPRPRLPWDRLMLLNIIGLFLFLGVAPAPSLYRLCTVSLPALILVVWLGNSDSHLDRALRRLFWAFALMLAVIEALRVQTRLHGYLDLPAGRTAISEPVLYERYSWVLHHTRPSECFFEAVWSDYYVPLRLRNPAEVPYVTATDYTRPEQVRNVVEALEMNRVRFVEWSLELDLPREYTPAADHLGPLRSYLRTHYRVVKTFADSDQVWERSSQPP